MFDAAWGTLSVLGAAISSDSRPGAVFTLQTAGETLNWNPHLHGIATNGVFTSAGVFQPLGEFPIKLATELFADKVLVGLGATGLIDPDVIANMRSWNHSGFSVWAGNPIQIADADSIKFLARYIDRGPVANSRIEINDHLVEYLSSETAVNDFEPLEFLARLSAHVPDKWESTTRYFGIYSSRSRGEAKKKLPQKLSSKITVLEPLSHVKASRTWAALIKRVFEVDPIACPRCGDSMKLKAFVTDSHELTRLLDNLKFEPWKAPQKMNGPPDHAAPTFDDLQFASAD